MRKVKPNKLRIFDIFLKNGLLYDFGINPSDFGNETKIRSKIMELDKTFDLMLFVENFSESMVLLKHSICWNYEDLANLKLNSHDEKTKTIISENARRQLKLWLKDSYLLYDYFKVNLINIDPNQKYKYIVRLRGGRTFSGGQAHFANFS